MGTRKALPICFIVCALIPSIVGCENQSEKSATNSHPSRLTRTTKPADEPPHEFEVPAEKPEPEKSIGEEAGVPGFDIGAKVVEPVEDAEIANSFSRKPSFAEQDRREPVTRNSDSIFGHDPNPERLADSIPRSAAVPLDSAVPGRQTSASGVTTLRVFYGTDRRPTGSKTPNQFFGAARGRLTVGFCDVSLPPNHQPGKLESPSIWRLEFRENPEKHVVLRTVKPVNSTEFFSELRTAVQNSIQPGATPGSSSGGEIFVFVHGFNATFKDAARRTAQIAYDLAFPGPPVMFSWPSNGRTSLSSYRDDARSAEWCQEHMMDFVTAVAKHSGAKRVHLIAHSMGNRVVAGALRRLAYNKQKAPRFNEVILTAPDIDAQTFKLSIAPRITSMADRFTVYASSDDLALRTAARINSWGDPRLGQAGSDLMTFPQFPSIDVIDASDVDTSLFSANHSYFAESQTVLYDLRRTLRGLKPETRGLQTLIKKVAWKIPERLAKIAVDDPEERFE